MPRPRTMKDWLRYIESAETTEGARRTLREYAKGHRHGRVMSRPRKDVALALDISERMVNKHVRRAVDDGLLIVFRPGRQGMTAEYEATFGHRSLVKSPYVGTGTIQGVPTGAPAGVPAPDCNGFGGSHHYYDNTTVRPEVARRMGLSDSIFTAMNERESEVDISLSSGREMPQGWDCAACGKPVEPEGLSIGFTVCNRCAVVVEVDPETPTITEETA